MIKRIILLLIGFVAMSQTCPLIQTKSDSVVACKLRVRNLSSGLIKSNSNGNISVATAGSDYLGYTGTATYVPYFSTANAITSESVFNYNETTNMLSVDSATIKTINGSTLSGGNLQLNSTSNATKGKILFGASSAYDGVNSRLGIGTQTPSVNLHSISTTEQLRLGYNTSNYATFTTSSIGSLTLDLNGTSPVFTFGKALICNGTLTTNSNTNIANFTAFTTSLGTSTQTEVVFGGATSVKTRVYSRGSGQTTLATGESYGGMILGKAGYTEFTSGTHAIGATLVVKPITITNGSATTTNTAGIYIEDANSEGIATNNYALWSDAGTNRLDGDVGVGGVTTPNSTIQINGSLSVSYVEKTTTYSVGSTDHTINCTSGTFTVTLPTAVGITGRLYIIKNTGAGTITLATTSSQTIDGSTTQTILTNKTYKIQSTGANWIIL